MQQIKDRVNNLEDKLKYVQSVHRSHDLGKNSGIQMADLEMTIQKLKIAAEADKKALMELERKFKIFEETAGLRSGENTGSFHERLANTVTGIIGLKEVVDSTHVAVKITWLILFLLGLGATIFFIYKTTQEYLAEPTATKVKLNTSAYYDVPTIAICPAPWMDTEKALSLGMTIEGYKYSLGFVSTYPEIQLDNVSKSKEDFFSFYTSRNFSSLVDYLKTISLDQETVYSSAQFENLTNVIKFNDRKSSLVAKTFLHYQTCYAYSLPPAGRSLSSAISALIKYQDKTMDIVRLSPDLWIHLKNNINSHLSTRAPVYILASYRTKVLVSTRRLVTTSKPDSLCLDKDEIPGPNYTDVACAAQCLNEKYMKMIGCGFLRYSTLQEQLSPFNACNTMDTIIYKNMTFNQFTASDLHEQITNDCFNACPPPCDRTVCQLNMLWQQWLPTAPGQELVTNGSKVQWSHRDDRQSYLELYIEHQTKYDGEILTFVEVSTYSFTELINNVGGTLGLFVGATLMTFAQLILFFVEYLSSRGNKYCANNGKGDQTEVIKV